MTEQKKLPPLKEVSGKYGAPMGRANFGAIDPDFNGVVYVEPILDPCPHACGAYDYGGAYWGLGSMVYRGFYFHPEFEGNAPVEFYFRSDTPYDSAFEEMPDAEIRIIEPLAGCTVERGGEPCDWCIECEAMESENEIA